MAGCSSNCRSSEPLKKRAPEAPGKSDKELPSEAMFTEYGIEGVVPMELLLPPGVRSKYQGKPFDKSKRAKEETKTSVQQGEGNQVDKVLKFNDGNNNAIFLSLAMAGRGRTRKPPVPDTTLIKNSTPSSSKMKKNVSEGKLVEESASKAPEKEPVPQVPVIGTSCSKMQSDAPMTPPMLDPLKEAEEKEEFIKSYAEAVGEAVAEEGKLTFIEAEESDGTRFAMLTEDDVIPDKYWDDTAVVCVLGANPPLSVMEGYIGHIWNDFQIDEVNFLRPSQYVVRFRSQSERDEAVKKKYYQFDNKPVYVRAWKPGCVVDVRNLTDILVWVQFPGLEMKYWSLKALSKISSLIRSPIKADKATTNRSKMRFARVQISMSFNQNCPEKIHYTDENKRLITQVVKYEWSPVICNCCKGVGHLEESCRKKEGQSKQKMVWKPKGLRRCHL